MASLASAIVLCPPPARRPRCASRLAHSLALPAVTLAPAQMAGSAAARSHVRTGLMRPAPRASVRGRSAATTAASASLLRTERAAHVAQTPSISAVAPVSPPAEKAKDRSARVSMDANASDARRRLQLESNSPNLGGIGTDRRPAFCHPPFQSEHPAFYRGYLAVTAVLPFTPGSATSA